MGRLHYDGMTFDFEDRLLAHLQVVISAKLRRSEPFFLSWSPKNANGEGRHAVWIDKGVPMHIAYAGRRPPSINRVWIETLAAAANSVAGLVVSEEPPGGDDVLDTTRPSVSI